MNRNIRNLENMPLNIKFLYSKILASMVCVNSNYNQLKLAEFYRIITNIELPAKKRIQLMNFIVKKDISFSQICNEIDLDSYLNDQEKNIFRFSLMKDLIIIMKADYFETNNERELLEDIQNFFKISNEQFSFFVEEYEIERNYFDENIDNYKLKDIAINAISTTSALTIPLVSLYCSSIFKNEDTLKTVLKGKYVGRKRKKTKLSSISSMAKHILLGITTYTITKSILNIKEDNKSKLIGLMKESMKTLHENTKSIIYDDIEYFTNRITEVNDKNSQDLDYILEIIDILQRTAATLENTEAVVI